MRALNISEMDGMDQGGRQEEISKIPIYRFKISDNQQTQGITTQEITTQGITTQASDKKSKGFMGKLFQGGYRHQLDTEHGTFDDIFIAPSEDALCCICLSEYEDEDLLCRLW